MLEQRNLNEIILETGHKKTSILHRQRLNSPTLKSSRTGRTPLHAAQKFAAQHVRLRVHYYRHPPSLSLLTVNGLAASRYVLLPVQAEFYALEGLGQLLETMKLIRKGLNPTLDLIGVLPTMVDARTSLSTQVLAEIAKHFPAKGISDAHPGVMSDWLSAQPWLAGRGVRSVQ